MLGVIWGKTWPVMVWGLAICLSCANLLAAEEVEPAVDHAAPEDSHAESVAPAKPVVTDQETLSYLAYREERVRKETEVLEHLWTELKATAEELEELRNAVDKSLAKKDKAEKEKIVDLVEVYERMKDPEAIAQRVMLLPDDIRYDVLSLLKKRTLSAVMLQMSPQQAAKVSERLLEIRDL